MADFLPLDLLSAIARAEATGRTDKEQAQFDAFHRIYNGIKEILVKETKANILTAPEAVRVVATILGGFININARSQKSAAIIVTELSIIMMAAATSDLKDE